MDEKTPEKAPKEKTPKVATAKKIQDLPDYAGEVGLYELSKQLKKGAIGAKYLVVARVKPRSGLKNTMVFMANEKGVVTLAEPLEEFYAESLEDAFKTLGYKLS